ncbi:S8 family serine peptidase [Streptomyces sp. NPDC000410]|uniref:S8 family serine peptidase n=1 Tax=Streptomyces sp. NPDC000410 TaxID=3154254 RepID=UPI003332E9F3
MGVRILVLVVLALVAFVPRHAVNPGEGSRYVPIAQKCATPATTVVAQPGWAQLAQGAHLVWGLSRGEGITVAVVDTGVDASVPQLNGHVLPGKDVRTKGAAANTDCFGRGTYVAGIIAAQPAKGVGLVGVAPGVRILPVRETTNEEDGSPAVMAAAIVAAVDGGAQIIAVTADPVLPSAALQQAVAAAEMAGVVVVAVAGGTGRSGFVDESLKELRYPAAYPTVLSVGGVTRTGQRSNENGIARRVDLVAPGEEVIGVGTDGPGQVQGGGDAPAAAFVAGAAALVRAYYPELDAAGVRARLLATADVPESGQRGGLHGWGTVSPYAAVAAVLEPGVMKPSPKPVGDVVPPPPDTAPMRTGTIVASAAVVVAALGAVAYGVSVRGRARRWKPAQ